MSRTSAAEVLVAEGVGLLLEDLGLDDTLGNEESMALAGDIASMRSISEAQEVPIRLALAAHLELAQSRVGAREKFVERARSQRLDTDPATVEAAQRILEKCTTRKIIAGLAEVPEQARELALHDFELDHGKAEQASALVRSAWVAVEGDVQPSALTELDIHAEASALRNRGWIFGFRSPSGSSRERMKPHLRPRWQNASAEEMAQILDRLKVYTAERALLRAYVAEVHPWVGWAVDADTGAVSASRVAGLRWLLAEAEAGNFGRAERTLLTTDRWRRLLAQSAGKEWARTPAASLRTDGETSHGPVTTAGLDRFGTWLAHPPQVTAQEFDEFVQAMTANLSRIARAMVVAESARAEPELSARVQAAVDLSQGSFGPADKNRARFRAILEQRRYEVNEARQILEPLRPRHPHLIALVGELREAQGLMLGDLSTQAPARGPLRVAIAGRTKAGKTSLRKVLTRDLSEDGIGRGAHRTTQTADEFAWERIVFVDTPGVSAKDDEYDAAVAIQTCQTADAVVWVFTESLHDEEAQILQSLLTVKPVLVVYNVKRRVDTPARLDFFVRNPHLAFGDVEGHGERAAQMAAEAGVRAARFVAAHVSAARRAYIAGGESHPAWDVSGIPELESELHRALSSQAQGLRSLRLADQGRTPVARAAARATATVGELSVRHKTFEHRLVKEERDLLDAVERAVDRARSKNHHNFAAVTADLSVWLEKVDGRGESLDQAWTAFLNRLDVDTMLRGISESLGAAAQVSGMLLDREDRLEEGFQRNRMRANERKGVRPLATLWRFVQSLGGMVIRNAPKFGRQARLGPVGWALVATDVLATTGRALTEQIRVSQIDRRAWERDAGRAARTELERVRRRVGEELDRISAALRESANDHFAQGRSEVASIADCLSCLERFGSDGEQVVAEIDKLTVERLLELGGLSCKGVIAVDRVPNHHLRVTVAGDPTEASRCLNAVLDGCSSELVTVTRASRKTRRTREFSA